MKKHSRYRFGPMDCLSLIVSSLLFLAVSFVLILLFLLITFWWSVRELSLYVERIRQARALRETAKKQHSQRCTDGD